MRNLILKFVAATFLVALTLTPLCSAQAQLVGDWAGTLAAGGQTFRIAWHVTKAPDGTVTSTFDNIDMGVFSIKVKSMVLTGSELTMNVDTVIQANGQDETVRGIVAGKISADSNQVAGTWTQAEPPQPPVDMVMKRVPAVPAAAAAPTSSQVAGDWQGTLSAGGQTFLVAWHAAAAADGSITSTFDNIDEGVFGIKIKSVAIKGSDVTMTVDTVIQANGQDMPVRGSLAGKISADGNDLTGTWNQTDPVQGPADVTLKRAQTPPTTTTPLQGK
jgi:hypothetical protein